jgi:2-keto-4-pentenoate hydratase/2-oxohepta-3-ene-1,7-dioic acid hydratase in catechol pathway
VKFATFIHQGHERVGLVEPDRGQITTVAANSMLDVIGQTTPQRVGAPIPINEVTLLAPIPRPARNLFCVGKNYKEHAKEFSTSGFEANADQSSHVDDYPAVFTKPASCVIGAYDDVDLHARVTKSVDYEAELAIVIGRDGCDISSSEAMQYVWGYTIVNDVTARDRQKDHRQWFLGKALDTFCPMGPWITTADEVNERDLEVRTWVNGELRQQANTGDLIFDIPVLISTISAGLTLRAGDIIATGTPAGVGIGFRPPKFLQTGDVVEISIGQLGTLKNRFR